MAENIYHPEYLLLYFIFKVCIIINLTLLFRNLEI